MAEQLPDTRISLRNLALTRETRVIFSDLSLELGEARIGVIGRNGAGKSQLLRLVAGLQAPDSGTVRLGGLDPATDRKAAVRALGILFQNPDHQIIFPTVDEELAFGLKSLGVTGAEAKARIAAMLTRFGRADWAGRNVQTLSQGQRHLLCLMAVLLMEPGWILLDEPFAGLDLLTVLKLNRILADLPQKLLHVTHDLAALAGYERVIWLDQGRVMGDGPAESVIAAYEQAMRAGVSDDRAEL